ncbi:histidine phosphatase family protein [Staphylococcus aureus]|uniref:histidine phosphatase family protein n=1 Tax=Staphylococcus aureus TaxID=1280 RepID=UPI000806C847|nr:histidine phosphatase family protein [Staphylococcus aureus]
MTIYLVRHGESKSNYDNKHFRSYFCGQLDVPLTDTGTKSADVLCDYFKEKQIEHVYVSDLLRTQQTFEHIFPYDIASTTTPLLRERSLGVFEGEYKDEISANPKYEKYFNDPNFKDFRHSFSQKAPEGESYEDVYQRVEHFMNHVVNEDTQKDDIVIVAHQVVIRCLMVYFNNVSREEVVDLKVENCKPYIIE